MALPSIISVHGVFAVSIQEEMSDVEAEELQRGLLERIGRHRTAGVLIDISGLDVVDSYFCRILRDTAAMARLMGAPTALVGMAAPIAVTLTELGLDLDGVHTDLSFERGLDWLVARRDDA